MGLRVQAIQQYVATCCGLVIKADSQIIMIFPRVGVILSACLDAQGHSKDLSPRLRVNARLLDFI